MTGVAGGGLGRHNARAMADIGIAPPPTARQRRWSLAAAIASVTVFGASIGLSTPLLSLLLEARGVDPTVNGLNAAAVFAGVIVGPLLTPHGVRALGLRNFLLLCFALQITILPLLKLFDGLGAWFALRAVSGVLGSGIFTSSEAWINLLAGDTGRGRIVGLYAAALSAGIGVGPLLLSFTGIAGWAPFIVNGAVIAAATVPLYRVGNITRDFGRERGAHPFTMFVRAPLILLSVALFGLYEATLLALLPIWGLHMGFSPSLAAATLSAVYIGSVVAAIADRLAVGQDRAPHHAARLRRCWPGGSDRHCLPGLAGAGFARAACRLGRRRHGDLSRRAEHGRRPLPRRRAGDGECRDHHRVWAWRAGRTGAGRRGDGFA